MLRMQQLLHSWMLSSGVREGEGLLGQARSLTSQGFLTLRSQTPLTALLEALLMALTRGMMKASRRRKTRMMMMKRRWSVRLQIIPKRTLGTTWMPMH